MPWFQRKARPWDDHWDLFCYFDSNYYDNVDLEWPVPDNLYLELTHVFLHANFSNQAPGFIHYPRVSCYRNLFVRWQTGWDGKSIINDSRDICFADVPLNTAGTKTSCNLYVPLPIPCFIVPGDRLIIDWFQGARGDTIIRTYFTFKSWRLY